MNYAGILERNIGSIFWNAPNIPIKTETKTANSKTYGQHLPKKKKKGITQHPKKPKYKL